MASSSTPGVGSMVGGDGGDVVLVIAFRDNFRNRFLFNPLTGHQDFSNVFGTSARFVGSEAVLSPLYDALHAAILYHENARAAESRANLHYHDGTIVGGVHVGDSGGVHHMDRDAVVAIPGRAARGAAPMGGAGAAGAAAAGAPAAGAPAGSAAATNSFAPIDNPEFGITNADRQMVPIVGVSKILSAKQLQELAHSVPQRWQLSTWRRAYCMTLDGASQRTFHQRVDDAPVSLLFLRDHQGKVLGSFASRPWKMAPQYFGTGESFVFDFAPTLRTFRWSGENSFFMLSDEEKIALGGGGSFALRLDRYFEHGSSGPCRTFLSPQLSSTGDFVCHELEVWTPED